LLRSPVPGPQKNQLKRAEKAIKALLCISFFSSLLFSHRGRSILVDQLFEPAIDFMATMETALPLDERAATRSFTLLGRQAGSNQPRSTCRYACTLPWTRLCRKCRTPSIPGLRSVPADRRNPTRILLSLCFDDSS
jgi:hypothetical protein